MIVTLARDVLYFATTSSPKAISPFAPPSQWSTQPISNSPYDNRSSMLPSPVIINTSASWAFLASSSPAFPAVAYSLASPQRLEFFEEMTKSVWS